MFTNLPNRFFKISIIKPEYFKDVSKYNNCVGSVRNNYEEWLIEAYAPSNELSTFGITDNKNMVNYMLKVNERINRLNTKCEFLFKDIGDTHPEGSLDKIDAQRPELKKLIAKLEEINKKISISGTKDLTSTRDLRIKKTKILAQMVDFLYNYTKLYQANIDKKHEHKERHNTILALLHKERHNTILALLQKEIRENFADPDGATVANQE